MSITKSTYLNDLSFQLYKIAVQYNNSYYKASIQHQ